MSSPFFIRWHLRSLCILCRCIFRATMATQLVLGLGIITQPFWLWSTRSICPQTTTQSWPKPGQLPSWWGWAWPTRQTYWFSWYGGEVSSHWADFFFPLGNLPSSLTKSLWDYCSVSFLLFHHCLSLFDIIIDIVIVGQLVCLNPIGYDLTYFAYVTVIININSNINFSINHFCNNC